MKKYKLGIVIPWRPQPSRLAAFTYVTSWYELMYPDAKIYLSDTPHAKFNVSAARNRGCLEAFSDGCDVVIVSDADVLLEKMYFDQAIKSAGDHNSIVLPYKGAFRPSVEQSGWITSSETSWGHATRGLRQHGADVGGVCVVSRPAFEAVNGWDENFEGWGHEDMVFKLVYDTLFGTMRRFNGNLIFLAHDDRDMSNEPQNLIRYQMYIEVAKDNPEGLKDVIKNNMVGY
jgi:predicted glycosyltransferase involved in capsule biosynthesis